MRGTYVQQQFQVSRTVIAISLAKAINKSTCQYDKWCRGKNGTHIFQLHEMQAGISRQSGICAAFNIDSIWHLR